jgi:hypothetical protein
MFDTILPDPASFIVHSARERDAIVLRVLSETPYDCKIKDFGERLADAMQGKLFYDEIDNIDIVWNDNWGYNCYKSRITGILNSRYIITPFGNLNLLLVFNKLWYYYRQYILYQVRNAISEGCYDLNDKLAIIINDALKIKDNNITIKSYGRPYSDYLEIKKYDPETAERLLMKSWFY